jgi:hypothetical protein
MVTWVTPNDPVGGHALLKDFMNISGLLAMFDQLPDFRQLSSDLGRDGNRLRLRLPASARPPILARLFADQGRTVLFVTGRVESVSVWQQAMDSWLPPHRQHRCRMSADRGAVCPGNSACL